MKITIETTKEDDRNVAKRLVACDDAFGLLWDIDQKMRAFQKYEENKTGEEMIEELSGMIHDEGLLDLYN